MPGSKVGKQSRRSKRRKRSKQSRSGKLEYLPLVTSNAAALARPGVYARCVYCRLAYEGSRIGEWTDLGTAFCAECGVDAVLAITAEKLDDPDHYRQVWRWHRQGFTPQSAVWQSLQLP